MCSRIYIFNFNKTEENKQTKKTRRQKRQKKPKEIKVNICGKSKKISLLCVLLTYLIEI